MGVLVRISVLGGLTGLGGGSQEVQGVRSTGYDPCAVEGHREVLGTLCYLPLLHPQHAWQILSLSERSSLKTRWLGLETWLIN